MTPPLARLFSQSHELGSQAQQRLQRVRRELAREHIAHAAGPVMVAAAVPATAAGSPSPDLPDERLRHVPRAVGARVGAAAPPVGVRERPVGVAPPPQHAEQRRQVVLVGEAAPPPGAEAVEHPDVGLVGDDLQRQGAVHLEPLRALAPVLDGDVGALGEVPVVARAAVAA